MSAKRDIERTLSTDQERAYLAQKLREAREYLGLSQEYVSQQTKMTRPAISEAEAGRRKVESLELKRLQPSMAAPLITSCRIKMGLISTDPSSGFPKE